jgi:ABC-type glycerol-3-phosphate transport system substrate-binding protein
MDAAGTTRRAWLAGVPHAGALVALALAGCSRETPAAGRLSASPVTLRVTSAANEMGEMAATRYPAFTAQHPNVTVQFEDTPDYSAKLIVLAAAESLGDLAMIYLSSGAYHYLAPNGVLVDHTPLAARDKYDLKQFYPLAVEAIRLEKTLYGLPFKAQNANVALFWNVEAFEARGLKQPAPDWTYADLADAAGKLTRRDAPPGSGFGIAWNWRALTTMSAVLRPWGGDVLSPDGKKIVLDQAGAQQALAYHYDLVLKQQTASFAPLIGDPLALFADGNAVMLARALVGNAGLIIQRTQGRLRWNMVRMPKGPAGRRGGLLLPSTMSITGASKQPDWAWEVCKWTCDKESGVALAMQVQGSSTPGARPDVYNDPRLTNRPGYPPQYADEQRQAMAEPEPYVTPWNFTVNEVNTALAAELDKITKGEVVLSAASLQVAARQLQTILDKPPPRLK